MWSTSLATWKKKDLIKGRATYINCLYKSIESVNWLLVQDITTVEKLKKGRQGIPSKIFDTRETDKFGANCHFEKR